MKDVGETEPYKEGKKAMYHSRPCFGQGYKYGVRQRWFEKSKAMASTPVHEFIDNGFQYDFSKGEKDWTNTGVR